MLEKQQYTFKTGGGLRTIAKLRDSLERTLEGRVLAGYRIESALGRGGMGIVFSATRDDDRFRRDVAIKIVPPLQGAVSRERFLKERHILAKLDSPNIALLHDAGETEEGWPFYVMERVEGEHIDEFCKQRSLGRTGIAKLFLKLVRAVASAHASLIIHRDIKASNVLVDKDGEPKLLDFGIAKSLDVDAVETVDNRPLTPRYASPEQLAGETVGIPSDVYQLGLLLLVLLSEAEAETTELDTEGSHAFRQRLLSDARANAPSELVAIAEKATAARPEDRYSGAAAMAEDLERFVRGFPVLAARHWPLARLTKLIRRRPAESVAVAALLAALLGSWIWYTASLEVQRAAAEESAAKATLVNEFLIDLFEQANPEGGASSDITADEMLQLAVTRVENLEAQPAIQAELFTTIGNIHRARGRHETAERFLMEGLRVREQSLGETHPDVANSLMAIGILHFDRGEFEQALASYEKALKILQEAYGNDVAQLIEPLQLIANVQYSLGNLNESRARQQRLLGLRQRLRPDKHLEKGHAINVLGVIAERLGEADQAEHHYRAALDQYEIAGAEVTTHYAGVSDNLGRLYREQARFEESLALHQKALQINRELLGDAHIVVAQNYNRIALVHKESGNIEAAETEFRRALETFERAGTRHYTLGNIHLNLAELLIESDRAREALGHAKTGVDIAGSSYSPGHWLRSMQRTTLARAQAHAGMHEESLATAMKALQGIRDSDVAGSVQEASVLAVLGECYKLAGQRQNARETLLAATDLLDTLEMGSGLKAEIEELLVELDSMQSGVRQPANRAAPWRRKAPLLSRQG